MITDVDLFFTKPEVYKIGKVSTLHLLRRDIYTCLGKPIGEVDTEIGTIKPIVIWPGIITIMTGIDLVSKFYCGNDAIGEVSNRFKSYVKNYISSNCDDIYQLRNALLHGFSLYSENKKGMKFRYVIGCYEDEMLSVAPDGMIWVSANHLHKAFEHSIESFQDDYRDLDSFSSFKNLYDKYGWLHIGSH